MQNAPHMLVVVDDQKVQPVEIDAGHANSGAAHAEAHLESGSPRPLQPLMAKSWRRYSVQAHIARHAEQKTRRRISLRRTPWARRPALFVVYHRKSEAIGRPEMAYQVIRHGYRPTGKGRSQKTNRPAARDVSQHNLRRKIA